MVARCGEESAAALAEAAGCYEVVPLPSLPLPPPSPPGGPFPEEEGMQRARAALHAHAWTGLRRLDRPQLPSVPAFGELRSISYAARLIREVVSTNVSPGTFKRIVA